MCGYHNKLAGYSFGKRSSHFPLQKCDNFGRRHTAKEVVLTGLSKGC